jgi:hypothetical protein
VSRHFICIHDENNLKNDKSWGYKIALRWACGWICLLSQGNMDMVDNCNGPPTIHQWTLLTSCWSYSPKIQSFPHLFITCHRIFEMGKLRRVPLVEPELPTLPEYSSSSVCSGALVVYFVQVHVMFLVLICNVHLKKRCSVRL